MLHDTRNPKAKDTTKRNTGRISISHAKADMPSRLAALQRQAHARNYCLLKATGGSMRTSRKFSSAYDNWGADGQATIADMLTHYGDVFSSHLESSNAPVMWNGIGEMQTAETPVYFPLITRIRAKLLPFAGVAFPVRLGASGNGYIIFTGNIIDIETESLIELHGKCYQLMIDLLQLEHRNAAKPDLLTDREIICLQMASDGYISEEIGEKLTLSVHTVNSYLGSATMKMDSVNRVQAIAKAIRHGYIV
jgi:DNA-binding CsgD family transcriptional regulator